VIGGLQTTVLQRRKNEANNEYNCFTLAFSQFTFSQIKL
jgi:hypothetical protein